MHSRCSVMHPGRESCAKNTTRATCARVAASACPNPSRVVAIIGTVAGLAVVVAIIAGHRPPWAPSGVSCQTLGLPRATSGFLRFPGASSTRTEMPVRRWTRGGEFPSVTAIAAASAVPNQLADVISIPGCASTVSYVVGWRVGMGMPCLTRSSWLA